MGAGGGDRLAPRHLEQGGQARGQLAGADVHLDRGQQQQRRGGCGCGLHRLRVPARAVLARGARNAASEGRDDRADRLVSELDARHLGEDRLLPHLVEELLLADHLVRTLREVGQHGVLPRREVHVAAVHLAQVLARRWSQAFVGACWIHASPCKPTAAHSPSNGRTAAHPCA